MIILCVGDTIESNDVKGYLSSPSPKLEGLFSYCQTFEEFKRESEKLFLVQKLMDTDWNIKKTAEMLKMQRSNLYKKIEKYELNKPTKNLDNELN